MKRGYVNSEAISAFENRKQQKCCGNPPIYPKGEKLTMPEWKQIKKFSSVHCALFGHHQAYRMIAGQRTWRKFERCKAKNRRTERELRKAKASIKEQQFKVVRVGNQARYIAE